MHRLLAGITVMALSLGTASAKEGWKSLAGQAPPAFQVERWLNTDGAEPQPRDLKGKVWMFQFLSVG